jgi:hypothetical protein
MADEPIELHEPTAEPVGYLVSMIPEIGYDASSWSIKVERRGPDAWAVIHHSRCLHRSGRWDYEPIPSSRTDRWIKSHRFPLDEALKLAKKVAPNVRVNGLTPAGYVKWWNDQ